MTFPSDLEIACGANLLRTMPGLPARPAAERIDIDEGGEIVGLS
jgi:formyltetrahydrofolate synthetase